MGFYLHISQTPDTAAFEIPSMRLTACEFSTNEHGCAVLTAEFPAPLYTSYYIYDRAGMPDVMLTHEGLTPYRGRLEDFSSANGVVKITALGYWSTLNDKPYTALWSTADVKRWRTVTESDYASSVFAPAKYSFDDDNRLYIALKKGEIYTTAVDVGGKVLQLPHSGARSVAYVTFTYDYTIPTNWKFRTEVWDEGFSGRTSEDSNTGDGANHTGTKTITVATANKEYVIFTLYNDTGSNYTNAMESDDWFVKITDVRVTTSDSTIDASDIVSALITHTNSANSAQLKSITSYVDAPGLNLYNEWYEDIYPAEIIDYLVSLGDAAGNRWEARVWDDRILRYQMLGAQARTWYIDVSQQDLARTISTLRNAAYAVYQDAGGRAIRSSTSTDSYSVSRYATTRTLAIRANTTNSTQAGYFRDVALEDSKQVKARASIQISELYDLSGALWPSWICKAGDVIVIRNMPPGLVDVDRIRSFRTSETKYNLKTRLLTVAPDMPKPGLDTILARVAAGLKVGGLGRDNVEVTR